MTVQDMVDSFESFQRCGPAMASVIRINGSDSPVDILRTEADWSHITKGRPVEDCRVTYLEDLIPGPRAVLKAIAEIQEQDGPRSKSSMSMR